jgi:hypothetical protein
MSDVGLSLLQGMAFRNVRGNRNRCPLNLTPQTVDFFLGECSRKPVDLTHQIHGFLPDNQIPMALHEPVPPNDYLTVQR